MIVRLTKPLSAADNALMRAWRRGELSDAEAQSFETRLFLEPALLQAAKIDQQIESGLQGSESRLQPELRNASRRAALRQAWPLALAAGVGALAVMPLITQRTVERSSHGNVEWVSVDVRRGSEQPMLIAPRSKTELVAMELPAPSDTGLFNVQVRRSDSQTILVDVGELAPNDGLLSLAFDRDALGAGEYMIVVRAVDSGKSEDVLRFRYQP